MAVSVEVPKSKKNVVLTTRVDADEHRKITLAIKEAGSTQDRFVRDAVYEKLKRGGLERTDFGVLRDLSREDRTAVQWIADVLRDQTDNALLRDILAAQRGVLQLVLR